MSRKCAKISSGVDAYLNCDSLQVSHYHDLSSVKKWATTF